MNSFSSGTSDLHSRIGIIVCDFSCRNPKSAINNMKCCSEPIVPVGSGDAVDLAVPFERVQARQTFPKDGFLVLDLPVVADVLPVAAARST